jgi:hypothetical protein
MTTAIFVARIDDPIASLIHRPSGALIADTMTSLTLYDAKSTCEELSNLFVCQASSLFQP